MVCNRNSVWLAASLTSVLGLISPAVAEGPIYADFTKANFQTASSAAASSGEPAILVSWLKKPAYSQFVPYTLEVASFRHFGSDGSEPGMSLVQALEYSSINSCVEAGLLKAPRFDSEAISCEEFTAESPEADIQVHLAPSDVRAFALNNEAAAE